MTNPRDIITVERLIDAPAERIFDLLADPNRHTEFDGSGTVKGINAEAPARLSLGATFSMGMQLGVKYTMVNTVTEFEENRRIAWVPKPSGGRGAKYVNRVWRYELEPTDGKTLVKETRDISDEGIRWFLRYADSGRTRRNMEKTLERIEQIVTTPSGPTTPSD